MLICWLLLSMVTVECIANFCSKFLLLMWLLNLLLYKLYLVLKKGTRHKSTVVFTHAFKSHEVKLVCTENIASEVLRTL